jgi:hypothetical protein
MLLLGGVAGALLLVLEAKNINTAGGWGWLLAAGIYVAATTVVGAACALCTAVLLFPYSDVKRTVDCQSRF